MASISSSRPLAYVLLWFPLASETFIFREVENLENLGLDVRVYTMYGIRKKDFSAAMRHYNSPVRRMGAFAAFSIWKAFVRQVRKNPRMVWSLMRRGLFRRMRNLEALGENTWCFMAGFLLAEQCLRDGIGLIHAPWANGPATAAWVASSLSGIPFAFTGRAGDIYPQDGLLPEKLTAALFARVNNNANVKWLRKFCPSSEEDKIKLVYNSLTFPRKMPEWVRKPEPPYQLLAVGRLVRTKGFPELFTAIARLKRENFPVKLTLVGDGSWRGKLLDLRKRLKLDDIIDMPGFIANDKLVQIMLNHDLLVVPSVIYKNGDRDGIPNVIMEACSLGMPVVATNVCGISEVIQNGRTGRLVAERDPAELAGAIREAFENWDDSLKMAREAEKFVKDMFDSDRNTMELKRLYQGALERNGTDAC